MGDRAKWVNDGMALLHKAAYKRSFAILVQNARKGEPRSLSLLVNSILRAHGFSRNEIN